MNQLNGSLTVYTDLMQAIAVLGEARNQTRQAYGIGNPASLLLMSAQEHLAKQATTLIRGEK